MSETVLQLGAGRFLRAFVDRFIHQANEAGQDVGRIVVVQTTAGNRAEKLRPDGFHVWVRGVSEGEIVDRLEPVRSVSRALLAHTHWNEVSALAAAPQLKLIVTNSTEAGYQLAESDPITDAPPVSMPAKLAQLLYHRFKAGSPGVLLLPCELIESNADKLRALVLEQAGRWALPTDFGKWVSQECRWLNNLVDCIVTTPPGPHPSGLDDPGLVQAEPYTLLAVQRGPGVEKLFTHPAIQIVDDLTPYYLRKVRILNGLHTAMAARYATKYTTVKEVLADREAARWLRGLLWEEVVPTIAYRVEGAAEFADAVWDRFRNPFIDHKLADILLNHPAKLKTRLAPTRDEYRKLFGCEPKRLAEVFAGV